MSYPYTHQTRLGMDRAAVFLEYGDRSYKNAEDAETQRSQSVLTCNFPEHQRLFGLFAFICENLRLVFQSLERRDELT